MYAFSFLILQFSLVLIWFWVVYFVYIDQINKHTNIEILLHKEKAYKLYIYIYKVVSGFRKPTNPTNHLAVNKNRMNTLIYRQNFTIEMN